MGNANNGQQQQQAQVQANMANIGINGNANINVLPQQPQKQEIPQIPQIQPVRPVKKAKGGMIYASNGQFINFQARGTDTVPAMLTPGEFVVNAKSTSKHLPLLKAINNGVKGYSSGGVVYLANGGKPDEQNNAGRFVVQNGMPVDISNPMSMNQPLTREQILEQRRKQYQDMQRARREAYEATPQGARLKANEENRKAQKEARIQQTENDIEQALRDGEIKQAGVTTGGTPLYSVKLPDGTTYSSAKTAQSAIDMLRQQKRQRIRDDELKANLPGAVSSGPLTVDDILAGGPLVKPLSDEQRSELELLDRGRKIAAQAGWDINEHNKPVSEQTWGHRNPLSDSDRAAFDAYQNYEIKKQAAKKAKEDEDRRQKVMDDFTAEQEAKEVASDERIRKEVEAASATRQADTKAKAEAEARRKEQIDGKYSIIPPGASLTVAEIVRSYGSDENKEAMLAEKISKGPPLDKSIIDSLIEIHLQKKAEREDRVASRKKEQEDLNSDKLSLTNRRSAIMSKFEDTMSQLYREEQQAVSDRDKGMAGLGNLLNTAITGDQTYNNRIKYIKQKRSILQPQLDRLLGSRTKGWFDDDTKARDIELLEEAENIYNGIIVGMRGAEIANTNNEIGSQMQTLDATEKTLEYTRTGAEMVAGMGVGSVIGAGRTATTLGGKIALGAASAAGEEAALATGTNAIEVATGQKTLSEAATDVAVRSATAGAFGGVGGAIGAKVADAAAAKAGQQLEQNIIKQEAADIAEATRQRIASQEFTPTVRSYNAGFSREGYSPMQLSMMDNAPTPMKEAGDLYFDLGGNPRVSTSTVMPRARKYARDQQIADMLMRENAATQTPQIDPLLGMTSTSSPAKQVAANIPERKSLVEMTGGEEAFNTARIAKQGKAEDAALTSQRGRPKSRYDITPMSSMDPFEATRARMSGETPTISPKEQAVVRAVEQNPSATVSQIAETIRNDTVYKKHGGLIYASNGALIPYSPRGTDTVPAMLTPGEFVVNRTSAQKHMGLLRSINNNPNQYFNKGGMVQYLAEGGVGKGGTVSSNGGAIDFSEFSNSVGAFGTYVLTIQDSFSQIQNLDFGVFKSSVDSLISSFAALNGPANLFNNAALAFGNNISAITTAINALSNIPDTININGRIDMPSNITVSLEGNTGDLSIEIKRDILNAVANALSQGNPGINVDKLREQS
jgi:hypothetical protein